MAQRIMVESGPDDGTRIEMAFRLATARRPSTDEREVLLRRLEILKKEYMDHPADAAEFLKVGESKRDENLDPIEHAAYAGLCQLILNLDETLTN